jgi:hypothetical protein
LALVAKLQQIPVHAPPGACPTRSGFCPLTKTQLSLERKAAKEAKIIAAEERKSAVAARKADIVLKRQQQSINSIEVKAAKATVKGCQTLPPAGRGGLSRQSSSSCYLSLPQKK